MVRRPGDAVGRKDGRGLDSLRPAVPATPVSCAWRCYACECRAKQETLIAMYKPSISCRFWVFFLNGTLKLSCYFFLCLWWMRNQWHLLLNEKMKHAKLMSVALTQLSERRLQFTSYARFLELTVLSIIFWTSEEYANFAETNTEVLVVSSWKRHIWCQMPCWEQIRKLNCEIQI